MEASTHQVSRIPIIIYIIRNSGFPSEKNSLCSFLDAISRRKSVHFLDSISVGRDIMPNFGFHTSMPIKMSICSAKNTSTEHIVERRHYLLYSLGSK